MIIIVSEDGMIDIVPKLMPQISRYDISSKIEDLRKLSEKEDFTKPELSKLTFFFQENQFYIGKENCDFINKTVQEMWKKIEGDPWLWLDKIEPNPDMNESFFYD